MLPPKDGLFDKFNSVSFARKPKSAGMPPVRLLSDRSSFSSSAISVKLSATFPVSFGLLFDRSSAVTPDAVAVMEPSQLDMLVVFDQFRLPPLPSSADLAASRMLQSRISPAPGVTPVGCQPLAVLHSSFTTAMDTFIVSDRLPRAPVKS